ncbi:Xaa-Pro peptidase family protein [Salinisphaera sp. Q1T1-3]|uniref:M24 family metallopeptidase n=1 Tax=Salinisphaera sp. Q1T1-3 TaxID=2321229 RepID=UPI000E74A456|nr:M24 family metallopeptidase [Salinisphaera sp. Q1T1-3]RJS93039.1 M24 family metallopeptidase [Salinisphaera sp. Q1T1-3]
MSERLTRLREAMAARGIEALRLVHRDNVAWLTEGATYHVVERAEVGVASLVITPARVLLVAPSNEIDRLMTEEPCPFALEPLTYPWFGDEAGVLRQAIGEVALASDVSWPGAADVGDWLIEQRFDLNAAECRRFAELGRATATRVEAVARRLRIGMTEREVEAEILHDCLAVGIRPVCTLVAFDDRIDAFPHPIPTERRLQRRALITVGAARDGLNVSLTRLVHFGSPDTAARERLQQLAGIHARTLACLRVGMPLAEVFDTITAAYAAVGVPEGWQRHHQGGPAGYGCRDRILAPGVAGHVVADQAFAFNPTLPGSKNEDTALLTGDGVEWLTRTGDWPLIEVEHAGQVWTFTDWLVREPEETSAT